LQVLAAVPREICVRNNLEAFEDDASDSTVRAALEINIAMIDVVGKPTRSS
jgi:hypothetical protein